MTESVLKIVDPRSPPSFVLSDSERHEIEHEISHYPDARAASIEALKVVQKHRGWVPDGAIAPIAAMLGIPAADLEGVATFYNLIFRHPVGRHVIKVCDSIACHLTGYDELRDALSASARHSLRRDDAATAASRCCRSAVSAPAIAARV